MPRLQHALRYGSREQREQDVEKSQDKEAGTKHLSTVINVAFAFLTPLSTLCYLLMTLP